MSQVSCVAPMVKKLSSLLYCDLCKNLNKTRSSYERKTSYKNVNHVLHVSSQLHINVASMDAGLANFHKHDADS